MYRMLLHWPDPTHILPDPQSKLMVPAVLTLPQSYMAKLACRLGIPRMFTDPLVAT